MARLLFSTVLAVLLPGAAVAQSAVVGSYVALGGGVDLLQNEFEHPLQPGSPTDRTYTFDPGPAADLSVGYGLGDGLRLEIEGDFANNHVHGVEADEPERAGGVERQYGGFGNVLYDLPLALAVHPYVGIGFGYQAVELDGVSSSTYGGSVPLAGSETKASFAYQGIAGFAMPIPGVRGLAATLEYRLIGVTTPSGYERESISTVLVPRPPLVPVAGFGGTAAPGAVLPPFAERVETVGQSAFQNIFNHEILVGLRYAFDTPPRPAMVPPAALAAAPAPAAARSFLVFFNWDRSDLTPRARRIVAAAAAASLRLGLTTIVVDGYADTSHLGGRAAGDRVNLALSRRRADSVRSALVADGVPLGVITVSAFGDTQLLVPTGSDTREPQNRRVSIVLR